jgi:hypothetical protein
VPVVQTVGGGNLSATHLYVDDGLYTVEVCITDGAGNITCAQASKGVLNVAPEADWLDLRRFKSEDGGGASTASDWQVSAAGHRVLQVANASPTFFYGEFSILGSRVSGVLRLEGGDDDIVGLALGFQPGDGSDPAADYLLLLWKRSSQGAGAPRGLKVYRIRGAFLDLFQAAILAEAELLGEATSLGDTGWTAEKDYPFSVELTATRLRLWISGGLEIDLAAPVGDPFSPGRFALYNNAQASSLFRDLRVGAADALDTHGSFPDLRPLDLATWQAEDLAGSTPAQWVVAADGLSVSQDVNNRASILYDPEPLHWRPAGGVVRPLRDDDWLGFALGFEPGDSGNPAADYLLVAWKRASQTGAPVGLRLFRVRGVMDDPFALISQAELLAAANTLGDTLWERNVNYDFRFESSPTGLKVWVNDDLEFAVAAPVGDPFTDGHFGLYANAQDGVIFRDLYREGELLFEGDTVSPQALPFSDQGLLDLHTGSLDWGDRSSASLPVAQGSGYGSLLAPAHQLADDIQLGGLACAIDNAGPGNDDTGCVSLSLRARNLPPSSRRVQMSGQTTEPPSGSPTPWPLASPTRAVSTPIRRRWIGARGQVQKSPRCSRPKAREKSPGNIATAWPVSTRWKSVSWTTMGARLATASASRWWRAFPPASASRM